MSSDKTARLWDAAEGVEISVLRGHEGPVRHAALSAHGSRIGDVRLQVLELQVGGVAADLLGVGVGAGLREPLDGLVDGSGLVVHSGDPKHGEQYGESWIHGGVLVGLGGLRSLLAEVLRNGVE